MRKRVIIVGFIIVVLAAGTFIGYSLMNTSKQTPATGRYAALGDSVAAGFGLPSSPLATSFDKLCRRSADAYPVQVATTEKLQLRDLACSGAKINDLSGKQSIKGQLVPSQIDRAFEGGTPKLITMSIGANDIKFTSILAQCYAGNCASDANTADITNRIKVVGTDLQAALQQIKNHSRGTPPTVVVVGYYHLVSNGCTKYAPRVTTTEASWINDRTSELNSTLQSTAQQAGARFAAVDFSGHDLCSSDPWIQDLSTSGALHPTSEGQMSIAQSIENALR